MAQKFNNVETFLIILVLFAIMTIGIMTLGKDVLNNDNANLDNDSLTYIADLNGVDNANLTQLEDYYTRDATKEETPILVSANSSQGNPKDYALDFLFAKEKGLPIENVIKRVFSIPSFIIVDLLRFNANDFSWLINIIGWFLTIIIVIAVVYFARGIK